MDVAAFIVAIVSAAGTALAAIVAVIARNDSKRSQEVASAAADRASVATERMASLQIAVFNRPPWRIEYLSGDAFLLTNNSPVDAHDVYIGGDPDPVDEMLSIDQPLPWEIGAMSAEKFLFTSRLSTGFTRNVIVTWRRDGSNETLRWKHPIPPKPKD